MKRSKSRLIKFKWWFKLKDKFRRATARCLTHCCSVIWTSITPRVTVLPFKLTLKYSMSLKHTPCHKCNIFLWQNHQSNKDKMWLKSVRRLFRCRDPLTSTQCESLSTETFQRDPCWMCSRNLLHRQAQRAEPFQWCNDKHLQACYVQASLEFYTWLLPVCKLGLKRFLPTEERWSHHCGSGHLII